MHWQPYKGCPFECNLAEITRNETVWRMRTNNVKRVYCVFVNYPCAILGQVWYLIVSLPDLCRLSYFYCSDPINDTVNQLSVLYEEKMEQAVERAAKMAAMKVAETMNKEVK